MHLLYCAEKDHYNRLLLTVVVILFQVSRDVYRTISIVST
jgi:hypothetical protein